MWKDTCNLLDKLAGPALKFKSFWGAKWGQDFGYYTTKRQLLDSKKGFCS